MAVLNAAQLKGLRNLVNSTPADRKKVTNLTVVFAPDFAWVDFNHDFAFCLADILSQLAPGVKHLSLKWLKPFSPLDQLESFQMVFLHITRNSKYFP